MPGAALTQITPNGGNWILKVSNFSAQTNYGARDYTDVTFYLVCTGP